MTRPNPMKLFQMMTRKKILPLKGSEDQSQQKRTLTVFDLCLYGIGAMCGGYIYGVSIVLVATKSGASSFVSNIIAGIVAALNGQCYAELSSRLPYGGGGYSFTYVICGELLALIIGWAMVLEYLLGFAFASVGAANAMDLLSNHTINNAMGKFIGHFPNTNGYLTDTPNILAAIISIVIIMLLGFGAKVSISVNAAVTIFSTILLLTSAIFMAVHSNINHFPSLRFINNQSINLAGRSDWLPFGVSGVIGGAALTFNAFAGFDALSLTGDVVIDPRRNVPFSINICIVVVFLVTTFYYLCLSFYLPWFLVNPKLGLSGVFYQQKLTRMQILAGVGEISGYLSSGFANMFALSQIIFSLSRDGLMCQCFQYISATFQVPIFANLIFGLLAALMALLFDMNIIANFMSAGTLVTFTIVAIDLLILRLINVEKNALTLPDDECGSKFSIKDISFLPIVEHICDSFQKFNKSICLIISIFLLIISCTIASFLGFSSRLNVNGTISVLTISLMCLVISCGVLFLFKYFSPEEGFRVKSVPFVPIICVISNILLASKLQSTVWGQLGIWLFIGLLLYLFYGMWHSRICINYADESTGLITTRGTETLAIKTD